METGDRVAGKGLPRWLEALFLLLLPPLTFLFFNFRQVHQANGLDPFYYTGYINNAEDLIRRFDLLYYAVRFGLILPGRFFTWALGAETGYFAFRYALALAGGVPLYLFAKRIFSQPVAILAYVALMVSPWFDRALLWDHPDATGVPFLLAAMCLVSMGRGTSWVRDGLAGGVACMAVNSNIFTSAMLGIFGVVYAGLWLLYGLGRRTLVQRGIRFGTGFLAVLAAGYSYYWWVLGEPRNIFKATFEMANLLNHGGMISYRTPGASWLLRLIHVLVPVLLAVCCLMTVARRRMRFETAVCAASGTGVIAFFYVHQFAMDGDTLELFYYFSYALPTTFLMLVCLWHALWERVGRSRVFLGVALAATLLPLLLISARVFWFESVRPARCAELAAVTILVVGLAQVPWRRRDAAVFGAVVMIAFSMAAGLNGFYRIARPLGLHEESEGDQYRVALALIKETPKLSERRGKVLFWYNNRPGNPINSVQSTYIWSYSKMNQYPPLDSGMPQIGPFQMAQLKDPSVRYVVVLGESLDEVQKGLQALRQAGAGFDLRSTRDLHSGALHVYWQMVELTTRPAK
ncbi:MAG: hypothetical protein ABI806_28920 [Candidatus Solibacter sp.]